MGLKKRKFTSFQAFPCARRGYKGAFGFAKEIESETARSFGWKITCQHIRPWKRKIVFDIPNYGLNEKIKCSYRNLIKMEKLKTLVRINSSNNSRTLISELCSCAAHSSVARFESVVHITKFFFNIYIYISSSFGLVFASI